MITYLVDAGLRHPLTFRMDERFITDPRNTITPDSHMAQAVNMHYMLQPSTAMDLVAQLIGMDSLVIRTDASMDDTLELEISDRIYLTLDIREPTPEALRERLRRNSTIVFISTRTLFWYIGCLAEGMHIHRRFDLTELEGESTHTNLVRITEHILYAPDLKIHLPKTGGALYTRTVKRIADHVVRMQRRTEMMG